MSSITSFKNICEKITERDEQINQYHCTAKGYETGCSMLGSEIKILSLKNKQLDQEVAHTQKQIETIHPCITVGQNMLERMSQCIHLLTEHNTCVSGELEKVTQKDIALTEEHLKRYEEAEEKQKLAHPLFRKKEIELKRLKIISLDLATKLAIKKRISSQEQGIRLKIFYKRIVSFAEFNILNKQIKQYSEKLEQQQSEVRVLLQKIYNKEKESKQKKIILPHIDFKNISKENKDKESGTSLNNMEKFAGIKKMLEFPNTLKQFTEGGTKVLITEANEPQHTENVSANVQILSNDIIKPPIKNAVTRTPSRLKLKDSLQEFEAFINKRRQLTNLSRHSSKASVTHPSESENKRVSQLSQEFTTANVLSQNCKTLSQGISNSQKISSKPEFKHSNQEEVQTNIESQKPLSQTITGINPECQKIANKPVFDMRNAFHYEQHSEAEQNQIDHKIPNKPIFHNINTLFNAKDAGAIKENQNILSQTKAISQVPVTACSSNVLTNANKMNFDFNMGFSQETQPNCVKNDDRLTNLADSNNILVNAPAAPPPQAPVPEAKFQLPGSYDGGFTSFFFNRPKIAESVQMTNMPLKNQNSMFEMTFEGDFNASQFPTDGYEEPFSSPNYYGSDPGDSQAEALPDSNAPSTGWNCGSMFSFGFKNN